MTRVLHVVENFNGQAVESWLTRLVGFDGFDKRSHQFDFFLIGNGQGRHAGDVLAQGCKIHLGNPGGASIPQMAKALRKKVEAESYDILHLHHDVLGGIFALALVGTGVKIVTHLHNCSQRLPVGGILKQRILGAIARRLVLVGSDAVVGASAHALSVMTRGSKRIGRIDRVIYCSAKAQNAVSQEGDRSRIAASVRARYGLPVSSRVMVFLGRLDAYKNPIFALEVLKELVEGGGHNTFLIVAGTGSLEPQLRRLAGTPRIRERVRMVGWVDRPQEILLASDLLLMPSQEWCQEGLGLVAVEAQACAVPVLCSLGVPADATLVAGMLNRRALQLGAAGWAAIAKDLLMAQRPSVLECQQALERSPFSNQASYQELTTLYAALNGELSQSSQQWVRMLS